MGLGPITVGITADISNFAKEAKKGFSDALPEIDLSAKHLGRMAGEAITTGVKIGMVAIGATITAALAGATYAFTSFTAQGLALADSLSDASQKLGIGSSTLLLFGEAARQTGTDVEAVQTAMSKLNIKVGEALLGNDQAIQSFAALGLSLSQLQGLAPDQQFQLVADAIGRVPDAAMRAAYAVDIFGKSGSNIVASLGTIGAKSQELAQYWIDLGAVITNEQINAAGGIQDRMDLMHDGLDRFKILLAAEMVPYLEYFLNLIEQSVISTGGLQPAAEAAANKFGEIVGVALDIAQGVYGIGQYLKGVGKLIITAGEGFTAMFLLAVGGSQMFIGKVMGGISKALAWGVGKFREFADYIGEMFFKIAASVQNAILSVFNGIIAAWNAVVSATGIGSFIAPIMVDKSVSYQRSQAGPMEQALQDSAASNEALAANGSDLIDATLRNVRASTTLDDALQAFSDGTDTFKNIGSWSDEFKAGIVKAAAEVKAKEGGTGAASRGGIMGAPSGSSQYAPGVQLPSSANYNTAPVSSYGPPITVNQEFATGVTAQDLRAAAQTIKRETIAAVQTKVAQGGNYRREIQC